MRAETAGPPGVFTGTQADGAMLDDPASRPGTETGSVYRVEPGATADSRHTYDRTLARLRELVPALFRSDDPTPNRTVLFRLHVDRMTGRAATSR